MRSLLIIAIFFSFASAALAQDQIERMSADKMQSFTNDTLKWNDEPMPFPSFPQIGRAHV